MLVNYFHDNICITLLIHAIISESTFLYLDSSLLCYFQLLVINSKFTTAHISERNYKNNFKFPVQ